MGDVKLKLKPPQASERLETLDALRGLAALAVVFSHALHIMPQIGNHGWAGPENPVSWVVKYTPVLTLVDGHAAVMVFFVLSGLVLGRQLLGPRPPGYGIFVAKRVARLYPPYAAAVLLAAILQALCGGHLPHGPSAWLTQSWTDPLTWRVVASYALMLGQTIAVDNPVWSLDYEMRLSVLLPLLLIPAQRIGQRATLAVVVVMMFGGDHIQHATTQPAIVLAARMALYAGMFLLGTLLAGQVTRLRRLPPGWPAIALGLLAWAIMWVDRYDAAQAIGAALLIAAVLAPGPLANFCHRGVPRFLGRISFSLYLIHVPLVLALLSLTAGWLPQDALIVALPPLAIGLGWVFYRLVESPSHGWARQIGRR